MRQLALGGLMAVQGGHKSLTVSFWEIIGSWCEVARSVTAAWFFGVSSDCVKRGLSQVVIL